MIGADPSCVTRCVDLAVEYARSPLGLDRKPLRLSWRIVSDRSGVMQAAFQIRVASRRESLLANHADVWDSDRREGGESAFRLPDIGLLSGGRYCWQVRIWDGSGGPGPWSEIAQWSMGLLDAADWRANWVTPCQQPYAHRSGDRPRERHATHWLRRDVVLREIPPRVALAVVCLGYYEVTINGRRVSEEPLAPSLTVLDRRAMCITHEIGGLHHVAPNSPLRAGKGTVYEGGIRVPLIVRAPGKTRPGAMCDVPVATMDLYPTVLQLAGLPENPRQHCDGVSWGGLLDGSGRIRREALHWHYPHYRMGVRPAGAIRAGRWKLIEHFDTGRVELFDLAGDLGEKTDLAAAQPDRAAQLRRQLAQWRAEVGARMPKPNPDYDASHVSDERMRLVGRHIRRRGKRQRIPANGGWLGRGLIRRGDRSAGR